MIAFDGKIKRVILIKLEIIFESYVMYQTISNYATIGTA